VPARPITFLSDYGYEDAFAGVCRAVIARIAPDAQVIDLTHGIRRHAVGEAAAVLANTLPYAPEGVHLAIVDPGVGSPRRALAVRVEDGDRVLGGPDNGLLAPAIDALGGARAAADVSLSPFRLERVSATFHGRDVFAPGAAHLARGVPFESVGPALDPASLVASPLPTARAIDGGIEAEIVYVDTFGNVKLSALLDEVRAALGEPVGRRYRVTLGDGREHVIPWSPTFGERREGEPLLYEDSYGRACIGVNRGNAAETLGLAGGTPVTIRPEDEARAPAGSG
jgi:S-adenosylmethionine hydrolase